MDPVCPLAFANLKIGQLHLEQLADTFYKKNVLVFTDLPEGVKSINASIIRVRFYNCEKIKLNRGILNWHLFENIRFLSTSGEIASIEAETFKSMKNLAYIDISDTNWRKLFQRGIRWTYDLNAHVRVVDLNDFKILNSYFKNESYVVILVDAAKKLIATPVADVFPDEDFCIYEKFPFEQMIVLDKTEFLNNETKLTCTFVWLFRHFFEYRGYYAKYYYDSAPVVRRLKYECDVYER